MWNVKRRRRNINWYALDDYDPTSSKNNGRYYGKVILFKRASASCEDLSCDTHLRENFETLYPTVCTYDLNRVRRQRRQFFFEPQSTLFRDGGPPPRGSTISYCSGLKQKHWRTRNRHRHHVEAIIWRSLSDHLFSAASWVSQYHPCHTIFIGSIAKSMKCEWDSRILGKDRDSDCFRAQRIIIVCASFQNSVRASLSVLLKRSSNRADWRDNRRPAGLAWRLRIFKLSIFIGTP